jgi:tRNA pseudouridine38-40 synthase
MQNIKLTIQYDGTRYNGWQKQGNTANTIQGLLTSAISEVCGESVELTGASRTDAGVHAYAQVANFHTNAEISTEAVKAALNMRLSGDIRVTEAVSASPRFHARYNASSKKYLYRVWNRPDANVFERKYSHHIQERLDIALMRSAAELLTGTHDFKGFSSDKRGKKSTVRTIYAVDITETDGMIHVQYHGDSFLYNMVRIMTGTLIEMGLNRRLPSMITEVFTIAKRDAAGYTVPPMGLFLTEVLYEKIS